MNTLAGLLVVGGVAIAIGLRDAEPGIATTGFLLGGALAVGGVIFLVARAFQ